MRKNVNVKALCEGLFEKNERSQIKVTGLTVQEIIKSFTKAEKETYDWLVNDCVPSKEVRLKIMIALGESNVKSTDPRFENMKEISFADAKRDIAFYCLKAMETMDFRMDFRDMVADCWLAMTKAWPAYMNPSQEYIDTKLAKGKRIFSSFRTFAQRPIQTAAFVSIFKAQDKFIPMGDEASTVHNRIYNIINNFYTSCFIVPTFEQVVEKAKYYDETVVRRFYYRIINNLDSNGELVKLSFDDIKEIKETDLVERESAPILKEKAKNELWDKVEKILSKKEFMVVKLKSLGKTNAAIGKKLGYSSERARQIYNDSIAKLQEHLKEFDDLMNLLK